MATEDDAQAQAYKLANPAVEFSTDSAIARKWLELKQAGTFIGVPIALELELDATVLGGGPEHQTAQSFTSGVVLVWRGGDQVDLI